MKFSNLNTKQERYSEEEHIWYSYNCISKCSLCNANINIEPIHECFVTENIDNLNTHYHLYCFYVCQICKRGFIAEYYLDKKYSETVNFGNATDIYPQKIESIKFDPLIEKTFPDFVTIYNDAYAAEQSGCFHVCGMGYRKALEFLVKEYLIFLNPNDTAKIENETLMSCIKNICKNENLKIVASRAAWLGNDECHFIRKFTEYDISDLKELLDVSLTWIEMELKTKNALQIMSQKQS